MNESSKCCVQAPIEPLNDIAQSIIDALDEVNCLSNIISERLYQGNGPNCQSAQPAPPAPVNLFDRLLCIRSLTSEIGSTLKSVRDRL